MKHYDLLQDKSRLAIVLVNCRVGDDSVKVGWAYLKGMIGGAVDVFCDRTGDRYRVEIPEECRETGTSSTISAKGDDYILRLIDG